MGCGASAVKQEHIGSLKAKHAATPDEHSVNSALSDDGSISSLKKEKKPKVNKKHKKQKKGKKKDGKRSKSGSSSSSSSGSSSDSSDDEQCDVITKTLLKEYLGREIDMLTLELHQPEVKLRQLLEQKEQTTKQLIENAACLTQLQAVCVREYQDLENLQRLIQMKQQVSQDKWDTEQQQYVEAYNRHKQLEEAHTKMEELSKTLDSHIHHVSADVRALLKLRKHQDNVLGKAFDGTYGSEREASIEEYVDKMKEFRKNILNTKTQWKRGLEFTKQANMQFWRGVQVWTGIMRHAQPQARWQHCAVVANFLHAAHTNCNHAVGCMKAHAKIPYFTAKMFQEVETSRRNVYTACQPRFHTTLQQWLSYYQQNAAYLEKWIEKTLTQTIEGDLTKVNGYLAVAEADLRSERKRLILERVKAKFGDEESSEVAEQEAEVERLSKEVAARLSVSIQTNVVTVSTGSDSGIESEVEQGPPPPAGTKTEEDVTQKQAEEEEQISVNLAPTERGMGIEVQSQAGGIHINGIAAASAAAQDGSLLVGDKILSINGRSTEGMGEEEARGLIASAGTNLIIVVIRIPPQSAEEVDMQKTAISEAEQKLRDLMLKRTQEEESAATAEAESRRRLDEAKAAIAALEEETARLEMEKEAAQAELEEKQRLEVETLTASKAAEEAATNAAEEQKEEALREAAIAAAAAEAAKADAAKWVAMAEEAKAKAETEIEATARAATDRASAQQEAEEAEESAKKAKEELDRAAAASKEATAEAEKVKEESKPEESQKQSANQTEGQEPNLQSDIDSIMNDYKSSVQQFNRKRGTEETRMDLDLQEKLRNRRQRRRQQMQQKLQEQKLLAAESVTTGNGQEALQSEE